jgi:hypothetical protein
MNQFIFLCNSFSLKHFEKKILKEKRDSGCFGGFLRQVDLDLFLNRNALKLKEMLIIL